MAIFDEKIEIRVFAYFFTQTDPTRTARSARRSSKILCDPYAATERSSGREAHAAGKVPVNEFADLLSFLREKSFIENLAKVESMR